MICISVTLAIKINCDFNLIENCVAKCYQCAVQKLIITRDNQTIEAINGLHYQKYSTEDVLTVRIIDQVVHYMPLELSHQFPRLTVLKIWSSGLRSFTQRNIRDMKYLTDLSLSGNYLETLDSNIFEFNQRITTIDFTRNRLKHIGSNLLQPLKNLIFADFYHNYCISDGARYSFDELKNNLRFKCQPTSQMMIEEMESLSNEIESLKREIEKREKKVKICEEQKDVHVKLNSLFPSILIGQFDYEDE